MGNLKPQDVVYFFGANYGFLRVSEGSSPKSTLQQRMLIGCRFFEVWPGFGYLSRIAFVFGCSFSPDFRLMVFRLRPSIRAMLFKLNPLTINIAIMSRSSAVSCLYVFFIRKGFPILLCVALRY